MTERPLHSVIDDALPAAASAFSTLGEVETVPGRALQSHHLRHADILIVRSVTAVTESLLGHCKLRFIGSATAGIDHIDLPLLQRRGIHFAHATGAAAPAVAQYLLLALLQLAQRTAFDPVGKTAAIIGCGHIGSRVAQLFAALGMYCLHNDPPRERSQDQKQSFVDLSTALQADVISLHVPLHQDAPDATKGLLSATQLAAIKDHAILINSARGEVIDGLALRQRLQQGPPLHVVLDVFENEPHIDAELLRLTTLATPHIAGYSLDSRQRAIGMLYRAACQLWQREECWDWRQHMPPGPRIAGIIPDGDTLWQQLQTLLQPLNDLAAVHHQLLDSVLKASPAAAFDRLRRQYRWRRDCPSWRHQNTLPPALANCLNILGEP